MFSDAKLVLLNLHTVPFESRLSNYCGFSSAAIDDFHDNIRSDIDKKANIFIDSLGIQKDRVELRIIKKGGVDIGILWIPWLPLTPI